MPAQPGKFVTDSSNHTTPVLYAEAEAGVPQLITSWESFKNRFGDFQDGNRILAHAVYGYFNNGGTRCWVARTKVPLVTANTKPVTDILALFEAIDEIALVAVPGATAVEIQNAVVVPVNPMNRAEEFKHYITDPDAA